MSSRPPWSARRVCTVIVPCRQSHNMFAEVGNDVVEMSASERKSHVISKHPRFLPTIAEFMAKREGCGCVVVLLVCEGRARRPTTGIFTSFNYTTEGFMFAPSELGGCDRLLWSPRNLAEETKASCGQVSSSPPKTMQRIERAAAPMDGSSSCMFLT